MNLIAAHHLVLMFLVIAGFIQHRRINRLEDNFVELVKKLSKKFDS